MTDELVVASSIAFEDCRRHVVFVGDLPTNIFLGIGCINRYDVYLTKEPNVYESMALVHSRVRRVVFGVLDREMGGLGGIAEELTTTTNVQHKNGIHSLPGTNHHYRAFRFDMMVNSGGDGDEEIEALKATLMQLHREDASP